MAKYFLLDIQKTICENLYTNYRYIFMISTGTKESLSTIMKESLFRSYATAEYIIKKYNLTKADKDKIDVSITDPKVKKAVYEILDI